MKVTDRILPLVSLTYQEQHKENLRRYKMGWAKYDEDIREVIEERRGMKSEYFYSARNYDSYIRAERKIDSYGSYRKETRIVKRPY